MCVLGLMHLPVKKSLLKIPKKSNSNILLLM